MMGALQLSLLYPIEIARTRIATDLVQTSSEKTYFGTFGTISRIVKFEGIRGIYAGYPVALAGLAPYVGMSYATYDYIQANAEELGDPNITMAMKAIGLGAIASTAT
jgi:solute carrier family 25 (adenine nucleotide translocator) protein 4/5/6/31